MELTAGPGSSSAPTRRLELRRQRARLRPQPPIGLKLSKLSWLALGVGAGAAAMFFFDAVSGGRRRALVRGKIVGAGHDAAYIAQAKSKRAADPAEGALRDPAPGPRDPIRASERPTTS